MKLIVGLGNPGNEYKKTRHNIGFLVLDKYLGDVNFKSKFNADYYETTISNEKVLFIKPTTYMNLSGNAVREFVNFYKIDIENILVIADDLDMEKGTYKLKKNSSAGGHNGLKSIIENLKTDSFARLKIGISNNKKLDTKDYVLGKFGILDSKWLNEIYKASGKIIEDFISIGIDETMHIHNTKTKE